MESTGRGTARPTHKTQQTRPRGKHMWSLGSLGGALIPEPWAWWGEQLGPFTSGLKDSSLEQPVSVLPSMAPDSPAFSTNVYSYEKCHFQVVPLQPKHLFRVEVPHFVFQQDT